jgi:uncharacterized protein YodC (DUF2158 family)
MANKFNDGDVVQLKSGGPLMTISRYNGERAAYYCQWFSGNELSAEHFRESALELYVEPPAVESSFGVF